MAAAVLAQAIPAQAYTESGTTAVFGVNAGSALQLGSSFSSFFGHAAGQAVTTGDYNTLIGTGAGSALTTTGLNTMVGALAGSFATGEYNVFLGFGAGYNQAGSHKLIIDNCMAGNACDKPLIYGEFDQRMLRFDGVVHVVNNIGFVPRSQLHFSASAGDVGGWLTSLLDNNFFMSSGTRWDAAAGGWIQRSPDGKSVMAGSGGAGYRIFTSSGAAVGETLSPTVRMHVDYDGNVGFNTDASAGKPISSATGAYLSAGGAWVNSSSRERKDDIRDLDPAAALHALAALRPVTFKYREAGGEAHVGFIAEDVPDLVATADRKGLGAMDVVAVLTKVVQAQKRDLDEKTATLEEVMRRLAALEERMRQSAR